MKARKRLSAKLGAIDGCEDPNHDPKTSKHNLQDADYMPYIRAFTAGDADGIRTGIGPESAYYWQIVSRAYAQAVSGKMDILFPQGRSVDRPRTDGEGTVWRPYTIP